MNCHYVVTGTSAGHRARLCTDVKTKALLLVAALVFGGIAVFAILADASGTGAKATPGGGYGGYGSKSPTPSRTRSSPPPDTPSPTPSEELPQTGGGNDSAITGLSLTAAGIVLLAVWWVWQAQNHGRQPSPGRHQLQPRHR